MPRSSFSFQSTRWWDNVDEARWILQSDTGQLYISQFTVVGALDLWGTTNLFSDPLSSNWAAYNPTVNDLDFNHNAATWIDPVANNLFDDIQAVGLYVANDTPSGELTKFSLDEIQFNAVLTPALQAASSSDSTPALAAVLAYDEAIESSLQQDELVIARPSFVPTTRAALSETPLDSAFSAETSIDGTSQVIDVEERESKILDLDEAFADLEII